MRTPPLPAPIALGSRALHRAYLNWQTGLLSALLLALLSAAIWYLSFEPELRALTRAEQLSAAADGSDVFMENVAMRRFNADGSLQQTLRAAKVSHAAETGLWQFQSPSFQVQTGSARYWTLQARTAEADDALQHLTLRDEVLAQRWSGVDDSEVHGREDLRLQTSVLVLDSVKQSASTDAAVIFTRGRNELTARGLQADLTREHLQFLHEVKARYVRP